VVFETEESAITTDRLAIIISSLEPLYEKLRTERSEQRFRLRHELDDAESELTKTRRILKDLGERKRVYPKAMKELKKDLTRLYRERFGKETRMLLPLCELLEVRDESMRHVIEGLLGDYRFFLVPDADESRMMQTIFTEIKDKSRYEGIGLIDFDTLNENKALIHRKTDFITTSDTTAQRFCNRMFKDMVVVDRHEDVLNRPNAVTKDALIHRGDAIHAIDPEKYLLPYIGERAIDIQLEYYRSRESELQERTRTLGKRLQETEGILRLVEANRLQHLSGRVSNFDQMIAVRKEKDQLERELEELARDSSWIQLEERLKSLEMTIEAVKDERRELTETISTMTDERGKQEERLRNVNEHLETIDAEVDALKKEDPEGYAEAAKTLEKYLSANAPYERIDELAQRYIKDYQAETEKNKLELKEAMVLFNSDHHFDAPTGSEHIGAYREELIKVETRELAKYRDKSRIAKEKCETSFQEDFISKLRRYIDNAYREIDRLNQALKDKRFGNDTYRFVITRSKHKAFGDYHDIIRSREDFHTDTLFTENISDQNRLVMKDLFDTLTAHADAEQQERELEKYTDYRSYMSYDIRITDSDGNRTNFSDVYKEKSGGETQTPFYVIIASSFDQLIAKRKKKSSGCLVLFDEAFNNMDEARIEAMMKFYSELNIQLVIAVPPQRFANIQPYVETTVAVVRHGNQAHIQCFNSERERL
ncbi:MAG: SbcC/MukB-like Walker B domain-containing protein, partial [Acholeplasmataceae bacterium]